LSLERAFRNKKKSGTDKALKGLKRDYDKGITASNKSKTAMRLMKA